jgi:hypothetical protein
MKRLISLRKPRRFIVSEYYSLYLYGETTLSGARYVRFEHPRHPTVWLSYEECSASPTTVVQKLGQQGMWLFGRAAPERITKQLAEIEEFPMSPTVDQPGWTRPHYALRDRQVFSPGTSIDTVTAVFAAAPSTPATAGTLKNWRRRVAFRLTGQALPSFMMALPFVGPLLDVIGRQQSVIFELIGAAGTGKTSLQKIAAGTPERFEDLLTGGHDYLACRIQSPGDTSTRCRRQFVARSSTARLPHRGANFAPRPCWC